MLVHRLFNDKICVGINQPLAFSQICVPAKAIGAPVSKWL